MNRQLVWTPVQWLGCEHLDVRTEADLITADSVVLAVVNDLPVRLRYRVVCDASWRTQRVEIDRHGWPPVELVRQGADRWFEPDGVERADLAGCVDVDITLTPFTNTLPIRRLGLAPGESADLRLAYVDVEPTLTVRAADQRYTRLGPGSEVGYRYQSGSFTADLQVDHDGVVTDYPGLWVLRHG